MKIPSHSLFLLSFKSLPISLVSLLLLSGCSQQAVNCQVLAKGNKKQNIIMSKGNCTKIADTSQSKLSQSEQKRFKAYSYDSYVKCYGIAAANMNDCGTKFSACGGSVSQARSPEAWIALPEGICTKLEGSRVEKEPKRG
jgi:uncharacterized membrane protein